MKSCVIGMFTDVPKATNSHVYGWSQYWARLLGAEIYRGTEFSQFDRIYIDHGVNFSGSINLFGGVTDQIVERLQALVDFRGRITSLDIPMPDYDVQLTKRLGNTTTSKNLTPRLLKRFSKLLASTPYMVGSGVASRSGKLVLGDSHSAAFAKENFGICRTNGKTLHGFLKDLPTKDSLNSINELTLVFGSIDIRHHICRQLRPKAAIRKLATQYIKYINSHPPWRQVEVAAPVPVEYEGRKVPKTGHYKGTPFYGDRDLRSELTQIFIEELWKHVDVVLPPQGWYSMDPKEYAEQYMERGGSVHISPRNYRINNWGLDYV